VSSEKTNNYHGLLPKLKGTGGKTNWKKWGDDLALPSKINSKTVSIVANNPGSSNKKWERTASCASNCSGVYLKNSRETFPHVLLSSLLTASSITKRNADLGK
jgi:hypothetical protein